MTLIWLAAVALSGQPVADAERAFAAQAQRDGQWKAFMAHSAPDAIMLAPGLVKAHEFLSKLKEPRVAVMWWPARTITSCDGSLAYSTGPFRAAGQGHGQYMSIWRRQPDGGWKWIYDGGVGASSPMAAGDTVAALRASCSAPRALAPGPASEAGGTSNDGTLRWRLDTVEGGKHRLRVDYSRKGRWVTAEDAIVG